jgi:hypothetical protein
MFTPKIKAGKKSMFLFDAPDLEYLIYAKMSTPAIAEYTFAQWNQVFIVASG